MLEVGKNARLTFHWKVSPYDFSKDKLNSIISKASKKYSIPREKIRVIPDFLSIDEVKDLTYSILVKVRQSMKE